MNTFDIFGKLLQQKLNAWKACELYSAPGDDDPLDVLGDPGGA